MKPTPEELYWRAVRKEEREGREPPPDRQPEPRPRERKPNKRRRK